MRKLTKLLLLVSILVASATASPALYAETKQQSSDSMMRHGMMNHGTHARGMMGMGKMMDHCSSMMNDSRPNE